MLGLVMSLVVELAAQVEPFTTDLISSLDIPRATFYQIVLDTVLLTFAVYILMRKPDKPEKPLTESEINQLIEEWEPEPLFKQVDDRRIALGRKVPTITASTGTNVTINNKSVMTLARTNFLGMICNPIVEEAANKALYKYGTGSCGPRGFYGTIDVHLELEQRINKFMDTEDCLIYAYGFATVSSAIPAFAGRGDLLIVDKGVSFPVQTGIKLSRSDVIWFEHNDVQDLERILQKVQEQDKRKKRKLNRRFIVVEGVYPNYGDLAPLPKIVELKEKYKYRLVMDDSFGVGIIGKTGRGTCEFHNVPTKKIDILTGGLESSVSSVGGFCCGNRGIIFHQRLNAAGYVFSASLPPLLTTAAHAAFDVIDANPQLLGDLVAKSKVFFDGLTGIKGMSIKSTRDSPVIHLQLANPPKDRMDEEEILQSIVDKSLENGVLISRAIYILEQERFPPPASIRIYVSAAHSVEQIKQAVQVIKAAASQVL